MLQALDPSMMQKLGGMGNIMNMVQEMTKTEGMGDMLKKMMPGNKKGKK